MYKILVVDDEFYVREGLKALINWEEYGFEICCEADNGVDALSQVKKFNPHLIITDIKMPEMDGLEFVQQCVQLGVDSKYIILSGFKDFEYARKAMNYGVINYLVKPIDEDELIESLNEIREELNKKELSNYLNYKDVAGDILEQYIHGEATEKILCKLKQNIPGYENGEFRYIIVKPIQSQTMKGDLETLRKRMKTVLFDIIGEKMSMYILNENTAYGIIITEKIIKNYDDDLQKLSDFIIYDVKARINLDVVIYSGKKVNGITAIKESYDTCQKVVNMNFFNCNKGLIQYEELKEYEFSYDVEFDSLLQRLMEAVERNNIDHVKKIIKQFFENMKSNIVAPEIIVTGIIKFELEIIHLISKINNDVLDLYKYINNFRVNNMLLSDIEKELIEFCTIAASKMSSTNKEVVSGVLCEVMEYINCNYNKSISLKYLAERFFVNPAYLGQIFKKKFGLSYNDYVNTIRIDKAKQLITNENLKIHEIAGMVGYNDTNYFICKFEKLTNSTPAEYRKAIKNII